MLLRISLVFLLLSAAALRARPYALIIGISEYTDVQGLGKVPRADEDARKIQELLASRIQAPAILVNRAANAQAIRTELAGALTKANLGPGDEVYIFLSARGMTEPNRDEGYLIPFDKPVEKVAQEGVAIGTEIFREFQGLNTKMMFFWADIHRTPKGLRNDNNITIKLKKMVSERTDVTGIAAAENDPLKADEKLPGERTGVFTTWLLREWRRGGKGELVERVATHVPVVRLGKGTARPFQPPPPKQHILLTPPPPPLSFGLLASLRFFSNGLGERMRLHREFTGALAKGKLTLAMALFQDLRQRAGEEALTREQQALAIGFEERGQRLITKYGIGDQFPMDAEWSRRLLPKQSDYEEAAKWFAEASKLKPGDETLERRRHFVLGRAYALQPGEENKEKALREFALADEGGSGFAEVYDAAGVIQLEAKDFREAEKLFRKAIKKEPSWAFPRHNMALLLTEEGKYREAEQEYQEAIRRAPFYPYLHHNLGVLLQRLRRDAEAEKAYQQAVDYFKLYEERFRERAKSDRDANAVEDEKEAIAKADALRRNAFESLNALATAREARGRKKEAMEIYRKLVGINRKNRTAVHNLAGLLMDEGRKQKDAKQRAEALDLYRENVMFPASRMALARALAEDPAQLAEAETVIRGADPKNREAAVLHARILIGLKRVDEALVKLGEYDGGDVSELRGDAALAQSKPDKARACAEYEKAWKAGIRNKSLAASLKNCGKRR